MSQVTQLGGFDQLSVVRAVHWLSRTGVRSPLTVERIKQWVNQFQAPEEKTLAWLILRNMIFRTTEQLRSSMRQAMKQATLHFLDQVGMKNTVTWTDALKGQAGLTFLCGPPALPNQGLPTQPGKSGDLIARLVNRQYGIDKHYPSDITILQPNERLIVVDDGTYTGTQLGNFLRGWGMDFCHGRVAIAVGMAHETACDALRREFPDVPLFKGELLTTEACFEVLSQRWIETEQWSFQRSPLEVYTDVHQRNQPFKSGDGGNGYGDIGALVAFEHGVPDDSIQLLWDESITWTPLVDR
ncbi:phosphoribosyltransferase-like protein [Methylibium petroleiphilum]|jgi:hypothetical protein|uniref:phosphoribosyltransferase-like protein n=1 Tax=Methylibium petroleiphilum TaxID=105560 RepID=UPI003D278C55